MNRIAFFLPVVAFGAAFLCGFNPHYWWAYLLIAAAAEGLLYLLFFLKNSSTEYLSGYANTLIHHFPWTERKENTESRTVNGKTEYRTTVSYVNHGDEYFCELNTGERLEIDSATFKRLYNKWHTPAEPIKVHHHHCVKGGDGEKFKWNGNEYDTEVFTQTHRYRNPIKNSNSPLRGQRIKKAEADALGLFKYPDIKSQKQEAFLVAPDLYYTGDLKDTDLELQHLNGFCGADHQIHVFMLLFPAKEGSLIALKQRDYWKGCNKNEFVVCLGVQGNAVEWCETLSWMDDPTLDKEVKEYFRNNHTADLTQFVKWLRDHLDLWKRKEVKDLKRSSLMTSGSTAYLWGTAIAAAILVFLCAFWIGGK